MQHVIPESRRLIVEQIRAQRQAALDQKKQKRYRVKKFFQDYSCHVHYIRHRGSVFGVDDLRYHRGRPYGVVISGIIDGEFRVGWSRLSGHDEKEGLYDRDDGILRAIDRLQPVNNYIQNESILPDVRRAIADITSRSLLYYKRK